MKLFEIIDTPTPKQVGQRQYKQHHILPVRQSFKKARSKGKIDYVGGGAFSAVFQHKNHPGTVIKVSTNSGMDGDGYLLFLGAIFKNQRMQANPYFPKVYSLKEYPIKEGRSEYVIEIERLDPLAESDPEEIKGIGDRIFVNYGELRNGVLAEYPNVMNLSEQDILALLVSRVAKRQLSMTYVKDRKLREACAVVGNLGQKSDRFFDMHSGNFMIRRTSVGPQLVITDPLV